MAAAVSVGVGPYTGSYLFPAIAGMFRERFPEIDLTVRVLPFEAVMHGVAEGAIDLGFYASALAYFHQFPHRAGEIDAVPWSPSPAALCGARDVIMRITPFSSTRIIVHIPQNMCDARPRICDLIEDAGIAMRFVQTEDAETARPRRVLTWDWPGFHGSLPVTSLH